MKEIALRPIRLVMMAALAGAVFIFVTGTRAAENGFPIYFETSKLIVQAETVNRTVYLPLLDIVQFLKLPYTDAQALETFTIRSGTSRLVLTKNSGLISINDQILLLSSPILHEDNRWLVPTDFLSQGLTRITGLEFRYRAGTSRMFAGTVDAPELMMNAQTLGSITRLTIRFGAATKIEVHRDDPRRVILRIDRNPLDPYREQLDHRDRLVRSIAFDDSDGNSKILVETAGEVDVRVTPAEGNEIFFIDFGRPNGITGSSGTEPAPASIPKPDQPIASSQLKVKVIVIDPGHGGIDTGAQTTGTMEKDLTLAIARKLRVTLQNRLGTTVLLTRDSDVAMDNEARSAVANNNQANFFISLHIGYSADKTDFGSSIFVMKEEFGGSLTPAASRERLFLPWYLAYRLTRQESVDIAGLLQAELTKAIPDWKFSLRNAPLGVLSSTTMPSIVVELGNLNSAANRQSLLDAGFQNRLVGAIATAIQRFADSQDTATH
jgi:N-acetylmuramoyl-L-alanine amidase